MNAEESNNLRVSKIGGSLLKSAESLAILEEKLASFSEKTVLVVSALHGVTDRLINCWEIFLRNENHWAQLHAIIKYHYNFIEELPLSKNEKTIIIRALSVRITELEGYFTGLSLINEQPDSMYDKTIAMGEKLSSLIISNYLKIRGFKCKEELPEKICLITNGVYRNAEINLSKCREMDFTRFSQDYSVIVVPGFYGISEDGKVTLLGRGGSDYTAAVLANLFNAKSLDVWKDVNGYYSADPEIIENTKLIPFLSYQEAAELSYFGAKILHPLTIEPIKSRKIPIRLFSFQKGQDSCISEIGEKSYCSNQLLHKLNSSVTVKSITATNDVVILEIRGYAVGRVPGTIAFVSEILFKNNINIKSIVTSQIKIKILLSEHDGNKALNLVRNLGNSEIEECLLTTDVSLLAVVGDGLNSCKGSSEAVFSSVSKSQVNIIMFWAGVSDCSIYLLVKQEDKVKSLKSVHKTFFE